MPLKVKLKDPPIVGFRGDYRFLSNFYPAEVAFEGETYRTVEHAYQAAKTLDVGARDELRKIRSAKIVKQYGKRLELREDWDKIRIYVMLQLLRSKFSNEDMQLKLLSTGQSELIEDNN